MCIALFAPGASAADEWAINIYGRSYHVDRQRQARKDLNEQNDGLGVRYYRNEIFFFEAGWFEDSKRGWSSYVGAAAQFTLAPVRLGLEAFAMSRPNYEGGRPFAAALPFISLQTGPVVTTIGYVPEDRARMLDAFYFAYWSIRF